MTTALHADINTNADNVGAAAGDDGGGDMDNNAGVGNRQLTTNSSHNKNFNNSNNNTNGTSKNFQFNNSTNSSNGNSTTANNQRATDTGKRKKLKSRTATVPTGGYSKDHLDAWLETCLKDASNTQLSSSSEFLDYNPTGHHVATTNANTLKNIPYPSSQQPNKQQQQFSYAPQQQQQQQQQQPLQQSQQSPLTAQQQQQQHYGMRTNFQTPMSFTSGYGGNGGGGGGGGAPFSQGFQRSVPNFMKHSHSFNNRFSPMFPSVGGVGSMTGGYYQQNDGQDFASLPPLVNMMGGGSSELENNSTDVLDGSGSNPNISRGFRFSDPCLLNPSDNDSKVSGQNTPDRRNHIPTELENNKFFTALMEQINLLHETNSKICRNLHETKVDIEALKHAPTWGLRHRRDSLSGLSTHSQPMVFGGGFGGMQSPAPTYHSGAYTPGMMTDVVREVKEAARVREDALLNRVKTMVEERQWSMNECNLRMMRDIEELKSQIQHLRTDRKETNKRLTHLEAENKYMRQMLTSIFNNRNAPDIIYENEALRTRKTFPNSRRSQSLNLHYGTIHHQPPAQALAVEEQEERLHIIETPSATLTADIVAVSGDRVAAAGRTRPTDLRNSFSSSDGGGSVSGGQLINGNGGNGVGQLISPPNFALVSPADEVKRKSGKLPAKQAAMEVPEIGDEHIKLSTQELQQELSDAMIARKEADNRIIALENLVKTLRVNSKATSTTHSSADATFANGVGCSVGGGVINPNTSAAAAAQLHYHEKQHKAHTTASSSVTTAQSSPKLSVAGPITDL